MTLIVKSSFCTNLSLIILLFIFSIVFKILMNKIYDLLLIFIQNLNVTIYM